MTPKGMVGYGKWIGIIIMIMAFPMRDIFGQFAGYSTMMFGTGVALSLGVIDFFTCGKEALS